MRAPSAEPPPPSPPPVVAPATATTAEPTPTGLPQSLHSQIQQQFEESLAGAQIGGQLNRDNLSISTLIQNHRNGRMIETLRTINIDIRNLGSQLPAQRRTPAYLRELSNFSRP